MLDEESIDTQAFFKKKKVAAFLKHEILKYLRPFVSKTGKYSTGNRVVIMDGFAGAGRYDDGEPGSPIIIIDAVRGLDRKLECHFVEKDEATHTRLRQVLTEEGDSIEWHTWHGTAEDQLDHVLDRATGLPLFLFIDPYHTGPVFDQVVDIFKRRPGRRYAPATEVLFRIDANSLRRILGVHNSPKMQPGRAAALRRVDTVAGGTWWRDDADPDLKGEPYLEWFFEQYLNRLTGALGCHGWYTDVKPKKELQPVYYLVFLTRHTDGAEIFGDNLSLAVGRWREKVSEMEAEEQRQKSGGQISLIDPKDQFQANEARLATEWHDEIERNLLVLLREHEQFVIREQYAAVFGSAAGLARETHLRVSLRRLEVAGITSSDSKGKLYPKTVVRAPGAQP